MRDIDDSDVDTLITVKGIVIRCSELIPDMQYFPHENHVLYLHEKKRFIGTLYVFRHAYFQCNTPGCEGCIVRELKEGVHRCLYTISVFISMCSCFPYLAFCSL